MDFEAAEVAKQVALIESEYYRNINITEFLNLSWSKKNRNETAPGIVSMIKRFNTVSTWVCTEVVKQEQLKKRTRMIKHFLKIASESLVLGNFNGGKEIF
jgi:son of sevenless-like protein